MYLLLGRGAAVVASSPDWPLGLATGLIGGSTGTLLTTLYLVIALRYPTPTRSTGLGLAMALGRIGAIAATYFGGMLLGSAATVSQAFYLALVAGTACAIVGIVVADRHVETGVLTRPDAD
jgi:Zn-dependent protease with chaperone function